MNMQNCQEFFLEDVIEVRIFRQSDCQIVLPPNVCHEVIEVAPAEGAAGTANSMFYTPFFTASIDEGGTVQMTEPPTLKVTSERKGVGILYAHDLQIPVFDGRLLAEKFVNDLKGADFHVVYKHASGSEELSYALPNTSVCSIETTQSSNRTITLKLKMQSMSNRIQIESAS